MLLCDGKSKEGDEGGYCQNWEEYANSDEELEAFEPGAPVVLQVHDVCDKRPECQNSCWKRNTHTHIFIQFILKQHTNYIQITGVEYHTKKNHLILYGVSTTVHRNTEKSQFTKAQGDVFKEFVLLKQLYKT